MLKLGFVQERAGNSPVTFYLWWWAQPSICPWYLSFPLKQKREFSAMQSICWWMDLDKNMEKKSINQSIIIWHMGCSFTSTIKRVGDTTAMPVLHYLTTTNGCQCAPCVHTLKLSLCFPWHTNMTLPLHLRSWWLLHPPILYKVFNIESNIHQVVQICKHLKTTLDKQRYQRQMNIQAWAHTVADGCCRVVQSG